MTGGVFDPDWDRVFPQWECQAYRALRNIEPGEEITDNYFFLGQADSDHWAINMAEITAMCSGTSIGTVQQYEIDVSEDSEDDSDDDSED